MVNSQVPKIIVNDNSDIELTVQVAGLMQETTVEIYGYVTQNDGTNVAYASFREPKVVLKPDKDGVDMVTVTMSHDELTLTPQVPVTVVTWVSETWPSLLRPDAGPETSEGSKPSWTIIPASSDKPANWP